MRNVQLIEDDYEFLADYLAATGSVVRKIGTRHECRYCGETEAQKFRKTAHSFPQGLGNRWFLSLDECDCCNQKFSDYDDALCKSVGPLLTILGVKGKGNRVRQTGRSVGGYHFKHEEANGSEHVVYSIFNPASNVKPPEGASITFYQGGSVAVSLPPPVETFIPRFAYKCLVKMGLAIMPEDDLQRFDRLRKWLLTKDESEPFPFLDVGLSIRPEFDAPKMVRATLLRRRSKETNLPYMLFVFCMGPVCWQIDLMPDSQDDQCGLITFGAIKLRWDVTVNDEAGLLVSIVYPPPEHMDWQSKATVAIPIENITRVEEEAQPPKHLVTLRSMKPTTA